MDSIRHAFAKSRSSSSTSSPPLSAKPRDSNVEGAKARSPHRGDGKRDSSSGIGKAVLGQLGSPNGRKHSRTASGSTSRSMDHSVVSNGSLSMSDRLEAVLARTDEVDAVNVAHLAQSISEMRGKSHGLHGIHPGMLMSDITPPSSSHTQSTSHQDFVQFSAATIARTRKAKADFEVRTTAMRLYQQDGKEWNPLQCLRDREVRRMSGEQLDTNILEGRTRDSSKAGSVSSFAATEGSLGEGRTARGRKRHSSPVQPPQRGHTRQQSSRHHAERYRMLPKGLENWSISSEELLSDYSWQQANPNRMINRHYQLIHPPTDDERRSDGVASKSSSFEYARARHSSDTVPLSPQVSIGSPLGRTTSAKAHLRNVPSFAMSSTSVNRSRSPSPVRSNPKHTRQTSELLDIPQRVKKRIQDRIKGDRSGVSSRAQSPGRSDTAPPPPPSIQEDLDPSKRSRAVTMPQNLRLDMDVLVRRPTIIRRPKPTISTQATESKRQLARTRARLISTGITTRAMLPSEDFSTSTQPILSCQTLMNKFHDLDRSLTTSFEHDFPQATSDLLNILTTLESRQTQISNQASSSLTKTRTETAVKIAEIASEQTSTLLLQLKAVEDKMDALEYRTNSGWTHEKTLHLVFLLLEYIVMVILWHLWVLISVLRYGKRFVYGVWALFWWIVMGIVGVVRWMIFL